MRLRLPALPRPLSGLGLRLMLFNCLLVFLPLAALMFLDVFETRMLESQEGTMAAQARVLAASLAAGMEGRTADAAGFARSCLTHLNGRTVTRLRVLDERGRPVADTSTLQPAVGFAERFATSTDDRDALYYGQPSPQPAKAERDDFGSLAYKLGSLPFRAWRSLNPPPTAADDGEDGLSAARNPAVLAALSGRYGSYTRISSGQRSVTLYAAVPVLSGGAVKGAVLASQSTWRTLRTIYEIRRSLFQIFLASLALALALSFLLSLTISRPLKRMREMAEGFIDQWGRPVGHFRPVRGSDELAALSRSLVRLGDGLSDHVAFIGSFASDLAHELRNPLASIRAAAELLEQGCGGDQERLSGIILAETQRIDRLVALSRDLSRLDLAIGASPRRPVDLGPLLAELVQAWELRGAAVALDPAWRGLPAAQRTVSADADFLRQALDKLVENAVDFSPEPGSVSLSLACPDRRVRVAVADRGPGVPPAMRAEIFRRFHTERREQGHTGLGLSLAQAIAEGFGGRIELLDRPGGGAVFAVDLPRA